jgi:hypothetical protein
MFCTNGACNFALQAIYVWWTIKVPTKQPSVHLPCLRHKVYIPESEYCLAFKNQGWEFKF